MATALNRFRLQTLIYKSDHIHHHSHKTKKYNILFATVTEPTNHRSSSLRIISASLPP